MQLSPILRKTDTGLVFYCAGCKARHQVNLTANGPKWDWDGNNTAPTFRPSILVTTIRHDLTEEEWAEYDRVYAGGTSSALDDPKFRYVCHMFVRAGKIEYLSDCTHSLRGEHDMQPFGTEEGAYCR